jgi:hypothetical protein
MTKLTDTQLIVLSSATKHDEGLATRPVSLNAAAATRSWMSAAVSSSLSPRKRATKKIEVMTAHLLPGEATRAALGVCKRVRRGDGIGPKLTDRLSNPRLGRAAPRAFAAAEPRLYLCFACRAAAHGCKRSRPREPVYGREIKTRRGWPSAGFPC